MAISGIKNLQSLTPTLFTPLVDRTLRDEPQAATTFNVLDADSVLDTSIDSTSSFKYNTPETGLRSTQQLNIDWTEFSNHTFFNSAQVKVNVSFDKIQNQFPFDGTKKETEIFFDKLTGYEKYVYDNYPKNKGYLFFSGTNGETFGGSYVIVKDIAGAAFPNSSRRLDGTYILSPEDKSMTIEYWLWVPPKTNDNQVVIDKHSGSMGYLISLDSSPSTLYATSSLRIISGSSTSNLQIILSKNQWNHIAWTWDRTPGVNSVYSFINGVFNTSSSSPIEFGTMPSRGDLYIGSGSSLSSFVPANTLSGAIDELRIWNDVRSIKEIQESQKKSVFANSNLSLYFKFNEASGSNTNLIIDSSANSLHGKLNTGAILLNVLQVSTSSIAGVSPVTYEAISDCPILFPTQPLVSSYRTTLLASASIYDDKNPSLITKLIPKHYLFEGQAADALETEEGEIITSLVTGTDPRTTNLGATQVLLLMLYTWAKFFDEMKLYTQAFSDIESVNYDLKNTVPDQFLQQLARSQGIELPPLFTGSTVSQFLEGNNVDSSISTNSLTLQYIQNQIWRRILINLNDIVRSKGTIHAVKSFIRAVGIDPDNNFRIREYGGPTKRSLSFVRDQRNEISTMLNFVSGGIIKSPYLSASRIEPGVPTTNATFTNGVSTSPSDGLFTSGSWTYEALYKFPKTTNYISSQSLARIQVTGSINITSSLLVNCVAVSASALSNKTVNLFVKNNSGTPGNSPLVLSVTGVDLFDGDQWYVSFGHQRYDNIGNGTTSLVSGSYFIRVAKQSYGIIQTSYSASAYYNDSYPNGASANMFSVLSGAYNASGAYLAIGSQSIDTTSTVFLNYTTNSPPVARAGAFSGKISQIRFWSKFLSENEWPEHVRDFKSAGIQNPLTNYNFVTNKSGSWERLRLDASTDQLVTQSNVSGQLNIFDFSQNNFHLTGTLFPATSSIIVPERYFYSYISPHFDEASTTEKVRVRSFTEYSNVLSTPWAEVAPVYDLPLSEQPTDSTKFTVDFSVVDTLNQDIITIFSTLDSLDNIIGNPELMFSPDYPDLENLRNVYFNRLTDKINQKAFFDFFCWFDHNIGNFISNLVPRKTAFLGTNFVIQSHMLERPKLEYLFAEQYLGDSNRENLRDTILLQFIEGSVERY